MNICTISWFPQKPGRLETPCYYLVNSFVQKCLFGGRPYSIEEL